MALQRSSELEARTLNMASALRAVSEWRWGRTKLGAKPVVERLDSMLGAVEWRFMAVVMVPLGPDGRVRD